MVMIQFKGIYWDDVHTCGEVGHFPVSSITENDH